MHVDGDTGYGNAMNVKRTVRGYASAGFAGILIEDQVSFFKRLSLYATFSNLRMNLVVIVITCHMSDT